MTRQRLGQHFLTGETWFARILATIPIHPNETWVEIGAGHGEMTEHLARLASRVIAIETDPGLAERLRERARAWSNVKIIEGDVLALDLTQFFGDETVCVYGNLPYYITSPILRHLFPRADRIASIYIVIQLEVAARIAARPGSRTYGYLSALCQFYARPEIVLRIPPGAFRPRPKVTSALVAMTLPGERASLGFAEEQKFLEFVRTCFDKKRKTLRNNLRALVSQDRIAAALSACSIRSDARAEQLTLSQFAALFRALRGNEDFALPSTLREHLA